MTTDAQAAAEWRQDPLGIAAYRWWDGSGWTGYTSDTDAGAPATDAGSRAGVQREVHVSAPVSTPVAEPAAPSFPSASFPGVPASGAPAAAAPGDAAAGAVGGPTRGPWPASIPDPPVRRATTLEEAAAGYGAMPEGIVDDIDWSRLSLRLKTAIDAGATDLLEVHAGDLPVLIVDVAQHAYWWDLPLADVPDRVTAMSIVDLDRDAHLAAEPGRDLDPLLWTVAHSSFDASVAPWMRPGDRYRLHRWPNLTTLPHRPQHLRAISLLGQAALTEDEFSRVAELDAREARQLLTTFSLMGLLRVSAAESRPSLFAAVKPKPAGGLFGRLAKLFGAR